MLANSHPDVQGVRAQLAEVDRNGCSLSSRVVAAIDADVRADRERVDALQRDLDEQHAMSRARMRSGACCRQCSSGSSRPRSKRRSRHPTRTRFRWRWSRTDRASHAPASGSPRRRAPGRVWFVDGVRARAADCTFQSGDDVRSVLGLPCLGLIPRMSRRALRGSTVEDYAARKPRPALAEQLRALRAGLSLWPDRPHIMDLPRFHGRVRAWGQTI